ncbi:MAG TPA: hypothetical protein VIP98_04380, partial [Microlunatus sp.]
MSQYVRQPCYPASGTRPIDHGWESAAATVAPAVRRIAVDGPAMPHWQAVIDDLSAALRRRTGRSVSTVDTATVCRPWPDILRLTDTEELANDPDFAKLAEGTIADLLDPRRLQTLPDAPAGDAIQIVFGPGAALAAADLVWWVDRPKRFAEQEVTNGRGVNLFQPAGEQAGTRRLFYIDWPLLDRHRDAIGDRIDLWLDLRDLERPTWIDGDSLRESCAALTSRPFRTLPTFNS